jgi:hypothetical protein
MTDAYTVESILAADCGTTTTRVFLIDLVDGQHRFVARGDAPTTAGAPHHDITVGVIEAIRQVESLVGRRLLNEESKLMRPERTDGTGVDTFVATASAAGPLQLVVAGIVPELGITSAIRAAARANAVVQGTVFLGQRMRPEEQIEVIRDAAPDAVLMVGGTDGGATDSVGALADLVVLASRLLERERRPELIFAGNVEARPMIAEKVAGLINFRPVDNTRPILDVEELGSLVEVLEALHLERKVARLPGFGRLSAWSPVSIMPGSKSFSQVVRFLAEQYELNVLGVSLGSNMTLLASVVDGTFSATFGSGWGVGFGAGQVLRDATTPMVARWVLDEEATPTDVADAVLSKMLYPRSVGLTTLEREAEQAVAREALRLTVERARSVWTRGAQRPYAKLPPLWDMILLSGDFLGRQANLSQSVLIVLDALQPIGVSTLVVDSIGLTEIWGALGAVQPLAAAQVLEHDGTLNVGTLICPVGTGQEGDVVMRAKLTYPDKHVLELEVAFGSIEVIPLAPGEKATLEMRPTRQFDIGWGHKGRGAEADVEGGILGLIIDARGRPLGLPEDAEDRTRALQKWRWNIGF